MSDYDSIESLQSQGIIDSKRIATIKICLVIFFHSCVCAVLLSQVFSIWLDKQAHLDPLQIGEIMGMKGVVSIFYKPVFGWLLDKTQLRIRFIITIAIAGIAAGPFFQFIYKPLLLGGTHWGFYAAGLLGGVYFGYVVIAGGGAVFTYCGRYVEAHGGTIDKIGASNMVAWLTMGFAMTIIYTFSPIWGFYVSSFAAVGMIVMLLFLKVKPFDTLDTKTTSKKKMTFVDIKRLVLNPRFYVLAFFSATIIVAVYAQYSQIGRYGLFFWPQDDAMQKYALRFSATLNVPFSIGVVVLISFSSRAIKALSSSKALIILSLSFAFALLVLAIAPYVKSHMAPDNYVPSLVISIIGGQILGLVNPFTNVVILSYITTSFNKKIAGIAFLIGFNFISNLCGSGANAVVGGMFKIQGWSTSYFELGIFIIACTVVLGLLMMYSNAHDKKRVMAHLDKEEQA